MRDNSRRGDWFVIDDVTGRKRWASQTVNDADGFRVEDADADHLQDRVRGRGDRQQVLFTRQVATASHLDQGAFDSGFSSGFLIWVEPTL